MNNLIFPNGAGKSTSLKAICGLIKETGGWIESGEVEFKGESIKGLQPFLLVKKGICLVLLKTILTFFFWEGFPRKKLLRSIKSLYA
ncbi:ATP-binding cassette domain-containing protein [candidate division WOR-3 bacterium]|nr:ATP-binding cassette domain-containing protein [candidate division WOR-3 bacterium]